MGSIWLVFLLFPLTAAFTAETSWAWRSFGVAAILAFAAVYVYGFIRIGRDENVGAGQPPGLALPRCARLTDRRGRPRDRARRAWEW